MLNFETSDVSVEFERIKATGAEVIADPRRSGSGAGPSG